MNGWLIKVSVWEGQGPIRLFAAADTDPKRALMAVQKLTNGAPKLRVETLGQLSSQTIRKLGLEAGNALDLTA